MDLIRLRGLLKYWDKSPPLHQVALMVAEAFGLKRKEAAAEEIPFDEAQSAGAILDDLLEV